MAGRVLQAGHALALWNRTPQRADALVAMGAARADTPAALAATADVIGLCVTDAAALHEVVFGAQGVAAGLRSGLVLVDHSTVHPQVARELAARLAPLGAAWVDAPVSGGPAGAREGRLAVFAGGDAAALARAEPLLRCYAGRITHLGGPGSGQAAKICNQMVSFGTAAMLAEALNLATRLGLDVARLPEAMQGGFADSAVLRHYAPAMLSGRYQGSTLNAVKDMDIALDLGRESGAPLPMAGVLASLYRLLVQQGHTELGMAGVLRLYAEGPLTGGGKDDA
jgi:3-hydroxyisobutyrate dehydrogenase-like beta-hydroxyacid dehydrogenase